MFAVFQSTRLYKPRLLPLFRIQGYEIFQSTRLYKPRPRPEELTVSQWAFQSTRLYKPRLPTMAAFTPDRYFNPRGCISLDSKNIQKIYSKLYPNTTIIQHLSNFITIQLQYILKFHYYLQKFGANPPVN